MSPTIPPVPTISLTPTGIAGLLRRRSCARTLYARYAHGTHGSTEYSEKFWGVLLTYAKGRKGAMCCSIAGAVVSVSNASSVECDIIATAMSGGGSDKG